ncbi:PfkB family carbohydrate kinase [Bosea sp. (in: a-proteobacteria)]|uniref:PfkB family carbohydrate kinase n=1 Tax=Bosea sp. (in: a-proteobacteria) TaxID=1871050 RepID=UPI00262B2D36|nr:PfkB family carbohydrate kinase [Bosea sp. (in: a-proteobacteria)]MCO5091648.1 PfkB family carbohydrate kinase [Bosea sp. (in: a-proteobacteria)]
MTGKPIFVLGSFVVSCSAKVARFPQPGESLSAEIVTIEAGGKGLNHAIMARRLDATVDGLIAVGDDLAAAFAQPALERIGLPASMLVRLAGRTGAGVGFTDAGGETCLAVASGANLALSAGHVRERAPAIAAAALVTAQFEIGDGAIAAAFALARRAGVETLLNPSPFRAIAPAILAATSILIVNETEAESLAAALGLAPEKAATPQGFVAKLGPALLERGPRLVVLTRGAAGAIAASAQAAPVMQPGFAVEAVDSLGAGDAFAATLGVGLAAGHPLPEALRAAAAAGALTTTRHGVLDALPDAAAVAALVRR